MSTRKVSYPGKCQFCKGTFSKKAMAGHLESCEARKMAAPKKRRKTRPPKIGIFHILVQDYGRSVYWLYIDIRADATLHDLDRFLRDIWLECCGHLSAFMIEKKTYFSQLAEEPPLSESGGKEYDMDFELKEVLRPDLKFTHDYDFGTTTSLELKVLSYREGEIGDHKVRLLARNDPPLIFCDECRQRAVAVICSQCLPEGRGRLCADCIEIHTCDEEMFLPAVNSPRTGQCGYQGRYWEGIPKGLKDDDLCLCGSNKEYIECCWIRDVLREKRRKARLPLEELRETVKSKTFQTKDELQDFADHMMGVSNRMPEEDFLGLSSEQIARILHSPVDMIEDIVRFNPEIPPDLLTEAPIVRGTLLFLSELAKVEPLKATPKGNLPRAFARLLFDEIDHSRFKKWIKFRSEDDSRTVQTLRHLLKMAGWIKKEQKKFRLTRKGRGVLAGGFSERDFNHLLQTYTQKFNWGFHDLYPEFGIIQGSWIFSLFILKKKAKAFTEDVVISRAFIKAFPEISLEVDETYTSAFEYITHCYSYRFLEKFCVPFGFVTAKREKMEVSHFDRLFIKTTPLFKKYFIWNERKAS